ncbi:MAG: hypothetical protein ACRCSK_05730 [Fusobacteriaceae bacterium]
MIFYHFMFYSSMRKQYFYACDIVDKDEVINNYLIPFLSKEKVLINGILFDSGDMSDIYLKKSNVPIDALKFMIEIQVASLPSSTLSIIERIISDKNLQNFLSDYLYDVLDDMTNCASQKNGAEINLLKII